MSMEASDRRNDEDRKGHCCQRTGSDSEEALPGRNFANTVATLGEIF